MVDARGDYITTGRTRMAVQWTRTEATDPIKLTVDSLNQQFVEAASGLDMFVPSERIDGLWYNVSALGAGGVTVKTPLVPAKPESEPGAGDAQVEIPEFTLVSVGAGSSEVIVCVGGKWRGDGVAVQPDPPETLAMKRRRLIFEADQKAAEEAEKKRKEEEELAARDAVKVGDVGLQQGTLPLSPQPHPPHKTGAIHADEKGKK